MVARADRPRPVRAGGRLTDFRRIALAYLDAEPTKKLAVAVLARAFSDLGKTRYDGPFRRVYVYRDEIMAWVREPGDSFEEWCDVAEIRPEIVRGWFEKKCACLAPRESIAIDEICREIGSPE